jgi:membrane-bound inhibitor of C-type lysozyme
MRNALLIAAAVLGGVTTLSGPSVAQQIFLYRCADGSQFAVAFQERRAAFLQLDGKAIRLPRSLIGPGPRYARGGTSLRINGSKATLKRRHMRATECVAD